MTHTVDKLIEDGYKGYSVRHILMNQEFRKRVINDPSVRGNIDAKNLIMDKLAVGIPIVCPRPSPGTTCPLTKYGWPSK